MDSVHSKKNASGWWQALLITHRYLGIAMSVPMLVWFLSGIVMMYVHYPQMTETERLRTLEPISWQKCCHFGRGLLDDNSRIFYAQLETSAGTPVLRLRRADGADIIADVAQGAAIHIDAAHAHANALSAAQRITGRPSLLTRAEQIETDQWTLGLAAHTPLFRFEFDDPERTNIYVSGRTGQVALWTTATQRFWNWLGAIPHWFYFASLRRHSVLWSAILISTATLGAFLTAVGLYLGFAQFGSDTKPFPYRGWLCCHHIAGLSFGIAALAWVFSGLISMNPGGLLEERFDDQPQRRLEGPMPQWNEVRSSLDAIRNRPEMTDAFSVRSVPFAGRLYWLISQNDGTTIRLDASGNPAVLTDSELADAAHRIATSFGISEQGILTEEDPYYFRHDDALVLPAYRVVVNDEDHTRYYIDPKAGALLRAVGSNGRWYRWLFSGPHRMDFTSLMRMRPIKDVLMLLFLIGGSSLTITGAFLAFARIRKTLFRRY